MYWVYGCLSVLEGCSLSPEWPELGDKGGAHGTSPVKPIPSQLSDTLYTLYSAE